MQAKSNPQILIPKSINSDMNSTKLKIGLTMNANFNKHDVRIKEEKREITSQRISLTKNSKMLCSKSNLAKITVTYYKTSSM